MSERQMPPPYDFSKFRDRRFQPIPEYGDTERVPQVVVAQTDLLLGLYRSGVISQPQAARDYLQDYTLELLNMASKGVDRVFGKNDAAIKSQSLDVNEAADFANIVFAWIHYFAVSQYLPNGFSRRGMLRAPTTKEQFLQRTSEIKKELALIAVGIDPNVPFEARPSALRAHNFFRVGAIIPLKFPDTERESADKERGAFDKLLGDTKIDL